MTTASPARRTPLLLRVLAVPVVAAVLLAGSIVVVGQLLPGNVWVKCGLTVVWFIAAGAVLRRLAEATSPDLVPAFRIAVILSALALTGWYANSWRPKEVQEKLIAAPSASQPAEPAGARLLGRGRLRGINHTASGTAELVESDGDVVVQLRDFDVQPGPDYQLYLTGGEAPGDGRELGGLKGTSGNQRYEVERRGDAERYDTVLIWCRAFSVPVAAATLR